MPETVKPTHEELLEAGIACQRAGSARRAIATLAEASAPGAPAECQARAHYHLSIVHRTLGAWEEAFFHARKSRHIAHEMASVPLLCEALNAEGAACWQKGDLDAAVKLFEEILDRAGEEDMKPRGLALSNLGAIAGDRGDMQRAQACFEAAHECFRLCGYEQGATVALHNLGKVKLDLGDSDGALADFTRVGQEAQEQGEMEVAALAKMNMAEAVARGGNPAQSTILVGQAMGEFMMGDNHYRRCYSLGVYALVAALQGQRPVAIKCYETAIEQAEVRGFRDLRDRLQGWLDDLVAKGA